MADLSGQYLGRYYLSERLGEGGMAVVYKAYDTRLERDVAVKIIRSAAFPPDELEEVLKRFEREAKSLAKLSHPNIVKVHDFGEHEGSPYLVMEYLPGGTLKKMLGRPIPWQDAVRLFLPVARGVAYAHQRGILHRDIKPANILITESGEPMLSDFGIAKLFAGEQTTTALTKSGMAIGTPEYMAPEQWTGMTSPQSDMYSLGIVLYEMVTGRKPYEADTPAAILIKQVTEPLPSPRKFTSDLPEDLAYILIKTLARAPEDRYKDLNDLIDALEDFRVNVSVIHPLHPEPARVETIPETASRKPVIPPPAHVSSGDNRDPAQAVDAARATVKEKKKAEAAEDIKRETPVRRAAGQVDRYGSISRYLGVARSLIDNFKPKQARKGWQLYFLIILAVCALLGITLVALRRSPEVTSPVLSGSSGGKVTIYQYADGELVSLIQPLDGERNWSPALGVSGNVYFTSDRDGKAEIYRLVDGKIEKVTSTPGKYESWSPALGLNENVYFTSNRDGKAEIYRLVDGKIEQVTSTPGKYESWSPALGLNETLYFTSNRDGKAEIYRLVEGRIEQVTNTPGKYESWSPALGLDETLYFASNRDGKAEVYRLIDGRIERVTNTPGQFESWGPSVRGQNVYFTSSRSGEYRVYVLTPEVTAISDFKSWTKTLRDKLPEY